MCHSIILDNEIILVREMLFQLVSLTQTEIHARVSNYDFLREASYSRDVDCIWHEYIL